MDEVLIDTYILVDSKVFHEGAWWFSIIDVPEVSPSSQRAISKCPKTSDTRDAETGSRFGAKPSEGGQFAPPWSLRRLSGLREQSPRNRHFRPILYDLDMSQRDGDHPKQLTIARTIHIPVALRKRIAPDAGQCEPQFRGTGYRLAAPALRRGCRHPSEAGRDSFAGSCQSRRYSGFGT